MGLLPVVSRLSCAWGKAPGTVGRETGEASRQLARLSTWLASQSVGKGEEPQILPSLSHLCCKLFQGVVQDSTGLSERHGSSQRWQFTQRSAALCITSLRPGIVNSIYHGLVPHCRHYQVTELKLDSSGWQLCPFIPVAFVCLWHHLVVGGLLSMSPD